MDLKQYWVDRGGSMGSAIDDCNAAVDDAAEGERWPKPSTLPSHMYPDIGAQINVDPINHPSHYTFGTIEVLDAIEDWKLPHHLACVVKYVARAPHKGNAIEDLKKARFYLDRWIGKLEGK